MARYKFDKDFEKYFIGVCTAAKSMGAAALHLKMNYKTVRSHAKRLDCFKSNQPGKSISKPYKGEIISLQEIFSGKHQTYQSHKLKKRLLREGYKTINCEKCFLNEWQQQSIPLELHHIDGHRYNNALENLQLLCPNCHALTKNYRARNIKNLSASAEMQKVEPLKFGEALSAKS